MLAWIVGHQTIGLSREIEVRKLLLACVAVVATCVLPGCEPASWFDYEIADEDGQATLKMGDGVVIILQGVSAGDKPTSGSFQVEGPGGKHRPRETGTVPLEYEYTHGHATIKVGGQEIQIIKNGKELLIGGKTFDLTDVSADNPLRGTSKNDAFGMRLGV